MSAENILERVDPALGHWLAGFIDGEGCFQIRPRRNGSYACDFALGVRIDDRPVIERIAAVTGIGGVTVAKRTQWAPVVRWVVLKKADTRALVALLDAYPLRAKKAGDYAIWREAVLLWQEVFNRGYGGRHPNQALMGELATALKANRKLTR